MGDRFYTVQKNVTAKYFGKGKSVVEKTKKVRELKKDITPLIALELNVDHKELLKNADLNKLTIANLKWLLVSIIEVKNGS